MNVKQLEDLADKLHKYRPTKKLGFYMGDWYAEVSDSYAIYLPYRLNECGTVACALGTAIVKGWIPKAKHEVGRWLYKGVEYDIEELGVEALGLNSFQFDYLFMPGSYPGVGDDTSAKDVARQIRRLISGEAPARYYEEGEQEKLRRAAKRKAKKQAA